MRAHSWSSVMSGGQRSRKGREPGGATGVGIACNILSRAVATVTGRTHIWSFISGNVDAIAMSSFADGR